MERIVGHFDELHFTEANFGRPHIEGRTVKIPVRGLLPLRGHPLASSELRPLAGSLIFRGVETWRRALTEYIGDPMAPAGFRDEYCVEDLGPGQSTHVGRVYSFEGFLESPSAWVDWDITAESFELELDDASSAALH